MKSKNVIYALTISLLMAGCGQTPEYIQPIRGNVSENASISDTSSVKESEDDSDDIIKEPEERLFAVAPEEPYFHTNAISLNSINEFTMPFAVYCATEDFSEIIDVPGITLTPQPGTSSISPVLISEPDEEGFIDVTISINSAIAFELTEDDSLYNNSLYSYSVHKAEFQLADYYSGIVLTNKDTQNYATNYDIDIEINGILNSISVNSVQSWFWEAHNWKVVNNQIPIYTLPVSAIITDTYTIHMPKDYDGLVMYVPNEGVIKYTQEELDLFRAKESSFKNEIHYILDDGNVTNYTFLRLLPQQTSGIFVYQPEESEEKLEENDLQILENELEQVSDNSIDSQDTTIDTNQLQDTTIDTLNDVTQSQDDSQAIDNIAN